MLGQKCQLGCLFIFYIHDIYFIFSQTPADLKMYSSDIHSPEIYSAYDIRLHFIFMMYDLLFTSQQRPYQNNNIMVVHRRTQVTTTGCSYSRCRVFRISVFLFVSGAEFFGLPELYSIHRLQQCVYNKYKRNNANENVDMEKKMIKIIETI